MRRGVSQPAARTRLPVALLAVLLAAGCDRARVRTSHYPDGTPWTRVVLGPVPGERLEEVWHPNGALRSERAFAGGLPTGVWRRWFPDGAPHSVKSYRAGLPDGTWIEYGEGGFERMRGGYVRGLRDGRYVLRWEDGTLRFVGEYREGQQTGVVVSLRPDGRPDREVHFDDAGQVCLARYWDEEGHLIFVTPRERSVIHGTQTAYAPNGRKIGEGRFEAGRRDGPWFFWRPDGQLLPASGVYADGERVADLDPESRARADTVRDTIDPEHFVPLRVPGDVPLHPAPSG